MNALRYAMLAAAAAVLFAASAEAQTVSIGTSPQGSSNYALGNALGKVLTDEAGLRARVVPFGGGQQFLPLINKKELELAIPSGSDALFAYQGKQAYDGKPNTNLRAIATVFPYYIGWYVKKDSPYKTLESADRLHRECGTAHGVPRRLRRRRRQGIRLRGRAGRPRGARRRRLRAG
jgi:TRAP transporter TAXI family solute receptor